MVRAIQRAKPKAKKSTKVAPAYIWGGPQDEAERMFIDCFAGGIAWDVETTGLGPQAEITEIALVRIHDGVKLFESRVRPNKAKMEEEAQRITGITDAMLKKAPYWQDIEEELLLIIGNSRLVAWSGERVGDKPFDARMAAQSHIAAGLGPVTETFFLTSNIKWYHRAYRQKAYGDKLHSSIRGGLERALKIEGKEFTGRQHGARVDAEAVAAVVRACLNIEGAKGDEQSVVGINVDTGTEEGGWDGS